MDYTQLGQLVKSTYEGAAEKYRSDDELEVQSPNHKALSKVLEDICLSFGRPIRVLEAGCGTGRFFHALKNTEFLLGLDISSEMLSQAKNPVLGDQVTVGKIELRQANIFNLGEEPAPFDFIYSLGMFGNGCPLDLNSLQRFHKCLAPGGVLFLNVPLNTDTFAKKLRKKIKNLLKQSASEVLPAAIFNKLFKAGVPYFPLSEMEALRLFHSSSFKEVKVSVRLCESPLWKGSHVECVATKTTGAI